MDLSLVKSPDENRAGRPLDFSLVKPRAERTQLNFVVICYSVTENYYSKGKHQLFRVGDGLFIKTYY